MWEEGNSLMSIRFLRLLLFESRNLRSERILQRITRALFESTPTYLRTRSEIESVLLRHNRGFENGLSEEIRKTRLWRPTENQEKSQGRNEIE